MKLALFSDVHGNQDAFQRVLEDIADQHVDRMVCLGDCVGYGPEPEQVVAEIRRRQIETVMGNHELAILDAKQLNWFNPPACFSLQASKKMLSADSLAFIGQLPRSLIVAGARFVHGYPLDSVRTYLFQKSSADHQKTFASMPEPLCFVGHTHDLEIISFDGFMIQRGILGCGIRELDPGLRYLINIGSVGQPRDGNNNAKYVLWEPEAHRIEVRFVPYDIAAVVEKINAAGLPAIHARRLW
jgi:predicted phosphodiesterase